jgi:hypothetical protein
MMILNCYLQLKSFIDIRRGANVKFVVFQALQDINEVTHR